MPIAALLSGVFAATAVARDADLNALTVSPASLASAKAEPRGGNPLWAIPVSALSETQARPLFSPSRRPPAAPVLASLASSPAKPPPPRKPEPDHPMLTLLGTIVGDSVEIGVFADEASHDVIRLKAGDTHDGWTLSSVVDRSAFFQKEGYPAATLALPAPGAEAAAPSGHAADATGGNARIRFAPPVTNFVPVNTEGGSRRPPKEG
ncbi:MAG: general secretion pathway protein GspN [Bradyrhizobiaceae bacterium]|nr:general secretion pathway protein GspN [Bradyrhizobiaceae bacterium]